MTTTKNLHKRLMMLLTKNGYNNDQRHDLVYQYTKGRTESTTELYAREMMDLCDWLQQNLKTPENELLLRKKRAVVLKIAQSTGIHDPEDWSKFNRFMLNRSILHKPLNEYNYEELNKLIQQFRKLEENYHKSANKYNTKAFWHRGGKLSPLN